MKNQKLFKVWSCLPPNGPRHWAVFEMKSIPFPHWLLDSAHAYNTKAEAVKAAKMLAKKCGGKYIKESKRKGER